MRKILVCTVILVTGFMSVSAQSRDMDMIRKLSNDWIQAYLHKDTASLSRLLSDDMRQITATGDILTKKDILIKLADPQRQYLSIVIDSVTYLHVIDNLGFITFKSTVIRKLNGIQSTINNCYSNVFMKIRGKWKAVHSQVTILQAR